MRRSVEEFTREPPLIIVSCSHSSVGIWDVFHSEANSNVGRVRIIEAISLDMEPDDIISLRRLDGCYRCELDNSNLVLDSLWLNITIVQPRRDYLLHIYNYNVSAIKVREQSQAH